MADMFSGTDFLDAQDRLSVEQSISGQTREKNRLGDWAELTACAFLIEDGYEVFRNVSCVGPVDLVAYRDGKLRLFDVKFMKIRMNGANISPQGPTKRDNQRNRGIEYLYVTQHGLCGFDTRALIEKYRALNGDETNAEGRGRKRKTEVDVAHSVG